MKSTREPVRMHRNCAVRDKRRIVQCRLTGQNSFASQVRRGVEFLSIQINQLMAEDIPLNVIRSRQAKMFEICRRSIDPDLNDLKSTQEACDSNLIPDAGSSSFRVHSLII